MPNKCEFCGRSSPFVSRIVGVCARCLRDGGPELLERMRQLHGHLRATEGLPPEAPGSTDGLACRRCMHKCRMAEGQSGYCALRWCEGGVMRGANAMRGALSYYHDPLPTNCVAAWCCPATTSSGYPRFTEVQGPEMGCYNLAVFYMGCSFDCLFCQNAQHRARRRPTMWVSPQQLAREAHSRVTCICFFGGDPAPQVDHALRTARLARRLADGRPMRICWETNGTQSPSALRAMIEESLDSGGIIKVDFKAWHDPIHVALCGVESVRTRESIEQIAMELPKRSDPPLLAVSTLMVPDYVDENEVRHIARFLASLNRDIPYTLLAFHPQFHMSDLPCTSKDQALACMRAAQHGGLRRVRIGNVHLLS